MQEMRPVLDATTQLNEVVSQIAIAGLVAYALEFMKKSKLFPWINMEKKKLQRTLAMLAALVTAIGVHYQYDAATTQFVISGSLLALRHGMWEFGKQVLFQQMIYDGIIRDPANESVIVLGNVKESDK
jgi:hypothetical protein